MFRVVIMSGRPLGKEIASIESDEDGQMFADEGNVVIYGDSIEEIEKQTGLTIQMV